MKKNLFIALTLSFAAPALTAFAQEPAAGCQANAQECNHHKNHRCEAGSGVKCPSPFDGLNLTADQQTALDALRTECRGQKAAEKKERACGAAERRKENLAKIKQILTPEQYVAFLENNFVNAANGMRPGSQHHAVHHGKHKAHDCAKDVCVNPGCKKENCTPSDCGKPDCKGAACKKEACKTPVKK